MGERLPWDTKIRGWGVFCLIAVIIALVWIAMSQHRYWGEPLEHGQVVDSGWTGEYIAHGRSSCKEIEVTVRVLDPRPGLPATTVSLGCHEYPPRERVDLQRRRDDPGRAFLDPIRMQFLLLKGFCWFLGVFALCAVGVALGEARHSSKTSRALERPSRVSPRISS